MLLSVQATSDVMVVKNSVAKHLEYTLEFVDDQRVVEELWQNLLFEVDASSTTEQYPLLSNIPKTEDALNHSFIEGQMRLPESMVVFIENDNVIFFNETVTKLALFEVKGISEVKLATEVLQLLYQMFLGRDDVDLLIGITVFDDFGTPTDNRGLTSTW